MDDTHQVESQRLLRVLEVVRHLAAPSDLYELLDLIGQAGREVLDADRGSVLLYDPQSEELFSVGGPVDVRLSIHRGITGQAARERRIIHVPDTATDPRFDSSIDRATGYHTRCLLVLPLIGLDDQLVGMLTMLNPALGQFDDDDLRIAQVLASQAAAVIQRARLLDERLIKLKLERDMAVARDIQRNIMPRDLPVCPGYELAGFARPADQTGGDIYDVIPLPPARDHATEGEPLPETAADLADRAADAVPTRLCLLLADATGHGIGPALSVTQVRAMVRVGVLLGASIDDLLIRVNHQLVADLASDRFVTAFLGVLDVTTHRLHYHAAGQGPLLQFHASKGAITWHDASTVPLGVLEDPPRDTVQPIRFEPGDALVLLTDGFYEHRNEAWECFGRKRIAQVVCEHVHLGARSLMHAIDHAVQSFSPRSQDDDWTALVVRRLP